MYQKLLIGAAGINGAYLLMSLICENMYNTSYKSTVLNQDGSIQYDKFYYPCLPVWFGSLLCYLFGFIKGKLTKENPNTISLREQITLGLLYTITFTTTTYSLLYLSYPVQVIGKNCRFLFVVIVAVFFSRVKHNVHNNLKLGKHKILVATVITAGVLLFNFFQMSHKDQADHHDPTEIWKGYILLIISILSDALFSDSQAYSKAMFKPTANHLFTSTNGYTFVFALIFSFLYGSLFLSLSFCLTHPRLVFEVIIVASLQVIGQISIYYVVANFKQHVFPMISTTRKIITVLLSIVVFKHSISFEQWIAIIIVFSGMGYELKEYIEQKKVKNDKETKKTTSGLSDLDDDNKRNT